MLLTGEHHRRQRSPRSTQADRATPHPRLVQPAAESSEASTTSHEGVLKSGGRRVEPLTDGSMETLYHIDALALDHRPLPCGQALLGLGSDRDTTRWWITVFDAAEADLVRLRGRVLVEARTRGGLCLTGHALVESVIPVLTYVGLRGSDEIGRASWRERV